MARPTNGARSDDKSGGSCVVESVVSYEPAALFYTLVFHRLRHVTCACEVGADESGLKNRYTIMNNVHSCVVCYKHYFYQVTHIITLNRIILLNINSITRYNSIEFY